MKLTRWKFKNGNKLNLCAGSLNLKRLFKLLSELSESWLDLIKEYKQYHEKTAEYMMNNDKIKKYYPMIIE